MREEKKRILFAKSQIKESSIFIFSEVSKIIKKKNYKNNS